MPALFEAYVTNLGKYNEGELVGEYLKFPCNILASPPNILVPIIK